MQRQPPDDRKLQTRDLMVRYGISNKTVDRWLETGVLPKPMIINRYRFWSEREIIASDNARMGKADTGA